MAGVQPTYAFIGNEMIMGGAQPWVGLAPITEPPGLGLWGQFMNKPYFSRKIPSNPNGYTGGDFSPQFDGSLNGGLGAFVKYHYVSGIMPDAGNGDNWFPTPAGDRKGGITPYTFWMHKLWERHPQGFRSIKYGIASSGYGVGTGGAWKAGGTALASFMTQVGRMTALMAANNETPDWKAIVLDASATDIALGNDTYLADLRSCIDFLIANLNPDKIIVVSHRSDFNLAVQPNAATAKELNRLLPIYYPGKVYVFDMSWATFGVDGIIGGAAPGPNNITYETEDYVMMGLRLGKFLEAITTDAPLVDAGAGIAVNVIISDSMGISAFMDPAAIISSRQASFLGDGGTTQLEYAYIYNHQSGMVERYDVTSNTNSIGSVATSFGIELTMQRSILKDFPTGVVTFKVAIGGAALTSDLFAGVWQDIKLAFAKFRSAVVRDLNRTPDVRNCTVLLGTNDAWLMSSANKFVDQAPAFINELNTAFKTRADGPPLSIVWVQPAPHLESGVAGGSTQGDPAARALVRSTVASLAAKPGVKVLLDPGGKYELQRIPDRQHYGMEAVFDVGEDAWALHRTNLFDDGETEVVAVDAPSETATFVVEDGTGLTNANSLCSVEFADQYHAEFGNPSAWSTAGAAAKRDALRQMTRWLCTKLSYCGYRVRQEQALAFPRYGLYDEDSFFVDSASVPLRVKQACAHGAMRILKGDWAPFPDELPQSSTVGGSIQIGSIRIDEGGTTSTTTSSETRLPLVYRLLWVFLKRFSHRVSR